MKEINNNDEIRIITKLKPGMSLDIYTDYQDEKEYQGIAILLDKVRDGDSFYLSDEDIRPVDTKEYNAEANKARVKYDRLSLKFKGTEDKKPNVKCKALYKELLRLRKDKVTDYENMKLLLSEWRAIYTNPGVKVNHLLEEFDDWYIIRFIQQDNRKNWNNSIFSYERWNVRFVEDHTGWPIDFITTRNIRVLKCVNPKETLRRSELVEYTTYDGMSSRIYDKIQDIFAYNKKKESKGKHIFDDIYDDFNFDDIAND